MKVYRDERHRWCLERDDGSTIVLEWNESSLLYTKIHDECLWEEVAFRFEDEPEWPEVEACKEDILDELRYEDNLNQDFVWDTVNRYVDLGAIID